MVAQRASRKTLRRLERLTGEPVVFANSYHLITTIDHRHLLRGFDGQWLTAAVDGPPCAWSSCRHLFGLDDHGRQAHFMRGACPPTAAGGCAADPGELHRFGCPRLDRILEYVPADHWPIPVHRPTYLDALTGRGPAAPPEKMRGRRVT